MPANNIQIKKHLIVVFFLILGLHFLPKAYPLYFKHVEFPRIRKQLDADSAAYSNGEYSPPIYDGQPESYEMATVTVTGNTTKETYYHLDGTIQEWVITDARPSGATTWYRGNTLAMMPGTVAFFWIFTVMIIRTIRTRQFFAWQVKWSDNTKFETYSFIYGAIIFGLNLFMGGG